MIALFETNEGYVNLFDHIANKMHQLQSLLIDNMWERKLHGDRDDEQCRREMVSLCYFQSGNFRVGGRQHYPHSRRTGKNVIERDGDEIREVVVKKPVAGSEEAVSCKFIDLFGLRTTVPIPHKCGAFAVPVRVSTAGAVPVLAIARLSLLFPAGPNLEDDVGLVFMPCIQYNHWVTISLIR